jgi:hypothetical protein
VGTEMKLGCRDALVEDKIFEKSLSFKMARELISENVD